MPFAQSKRIMDDAIQGVRRFLTTHTVQYDQKSLNLVILIEEKYQVGSG